MTREHRARAGPWFSGVLLALATAFLGLSLGSLWARLFVRGKSVGFDAIADTLGAAMVGTFLGFVVGILLAALLSTRAKVVGTAAAGIAALGVVAALAATRPSPKALEPANPPHRAFEPAFSVGVRVSHSEEILGAIPAGNEPIPFSEGKVWTVGPEVLRTGWAPDFESCTAEPTEDQLAAIVPFLRAAMAEAGAICRTEREGDLILSFAMRLAEERGAASIEADCLAERPTLAALVQAISDLHDELDGRFSCRSARPRALAPGGVD